MYVLESVKTSTEYLHTYKCRISDFSKFSFDSNM